MTSEILAVLAVRHGAVSYGPDPAVTFDPVTGLVAFPNPKNRTCVPVVSYISPNGASATETVYIKEFGPTTVIVWQGALDTSARNHAPTDFTLMVAGI